MKLEELKLVQSPRLLLSYLGNKYFKMKCHFIPFIFKPKFLKCAHLEYWKLPPSANTFRARTRLVSLYLCWVHSNGLPLHPGVLQGSFSGFWWWLPTNLQKFGAHTNWTNFLKVGNGDRSYHSFQLRPTPPPHTNHGLSKVDKDR